MAGSLIGSFGSLTIVPNLRIASWNVKGLTTKSEARVEIIKHVAEAIKCYELDIVAFQEISSNYALQGLCKALNENEMYNPWNYASQEVGQNDFLKLGFVWKCGIEHEWHDLPVDYFERRPYHLKFKFEGSTINLVNLHLIHRGNDQSSRKVEISKKINSDKEQDQLIDLVHGVCPTDQRGTYVFLIGDFNCFPSSKGLQDNKYANLFPLRMYTNTKQDECYDNIIVPDKIVHDKRLCRNVVVITDHHLKNVSDHFPICADFYFPTA